MNKIKLFAKLSTNLFIPGKLFKNVFMFARKQTKFNSIKNFLCSQNLISILKKNFIMTNIIKINFRLINKTLLFSNKNAITKDFKKHYSSGRSYSTEDQIIIIFIFCMIFICITTGNPPTPPLMFPMFPIIFFK
jgi:hypothetical protein